MRTEKLDLCKICGKMFLKTRDANVCPVCVPKKYSPEFTAQSENPVPLIKNEEPIRENTNEKKNENWSLKFDRCVKCGRNDVKHVARGLCLSYYQKETEKRNRGRQRQKKGLAANILDRKYLYKEYVSKKRSLIDIAKDCDCSRQYVYKRLIEFNIPLRTQKEARKLAYDRNKISYMTTDSDGIERLVTQRSIKLNENFFVSWSKEMAYVLGVVYTDGHINPGRKLDPSQKTTTASPRLVITQKESELPSKVSKLMDCNMKLRYRKRRGTAGALYVFDVCSEKIYDDLISFGLSPQKSKTIEFPNIPQEFVRHFIRGCWDGDGSIFFEQNRLRASYISGSKKFIERLVEELSKIGIDKRTPPDGRLPLTVFKDKRANAYYIKISGKENIKKLFHYFYDGVDESMYLSRKYNTFVKGLKLEKTEPEQLTLDLDF